MDCVPPTITVAGEGLTVTVATGTGVTVRDAVPVFPSLVAEIVTGPPGATPVTTPVLGLTVATAPLLELHVIERPVSVLLPASLVVATNCCVAPTCTVAEPGVTVTVATGTSVTVIAEVPVLPSLDAVIVAVPADTAVTSPLASTVAAALSDDQDRARPVSTAPEASRVTPFNCCVFPTTTLADDGLTVTVATGAVVTVIADVPV
jgi:hypothetical protein